MVNKSSTQFISTLARRRRRLARLRRLGFAGSGPSKPPQQPPKRPEKKPQVEVLYFPSTLCDNFQSPSVGASLDSDGSLNDTKEERLSGRSPLSPSIIPSTITLFSLSPEPPSPCKPSHSERVTDSACSPTLFSHRATTDVRVTRSSYSYQNGFPESQQCTSVDHVKEETSSMSSYSISNVVTGRRVVDLGLILEKFESIAQHPLQCPKGRMIALSEEISSLRSTIRFMCDECGQEAALESDLHLIF